MKVWLCNYRRRRVLPLPPFAPETTFLCALCPVRIIPHCPPKISRSSAAGKKKKKKKKKKYGWGKKHRRTFLSRRQKLAWKALQPSDAHGNKFRTSDPGTSLLLIHSVLFLFSVRLRLYATTLRLFTCALIYMVMTVMMLEKEMNKSGIFVPSLPLLALPAALGY